MLLVVASASPVDCDVVSDGVVAEVVELVLLVIPAVLLDVDTGDVEVVTVELVPALGELAVVELEAWVDVPTVDELEAGIALVVAPSVDVADERVVVPVLELTRVLDEGTDVVDDGACVVLVALVEALDPVVLLVPVDVLEASLVLVVCAVVEAGLALEVTTVLDAVVVGAEKNRGYMSQCCQNIKKQKLLTRCVFFIFQLKPCMKTLALNDVISAAYKLSTQHNYHKKTYMCHGY